MTIEYEENGLEQNWNKTDKEEIDNLRKKLLETEKRIAEIEDSLVDKIKLEKERQLKLAQEEAKALKAKIKVVWNKGDRNYFENRRNTPEYQETLERIIKEQAEKTRLEREWKEKGL